MKLFTKSLLTAAALVIPFTGNAGEYYCAPSCNSNSCCDNTGYVFAYGGFSFGFEMNGLMPFEADQTLQNEDFQVDDGFILGGGVGVRSCFLGGTRFELEGLYTENEINEISFPSRGGETFNNRFRGNMSTRAALANVVKEFPIGCMTGFVGGGFGISSNEFSVTDTVANAYGNDTDTALAYQFIAGVDVPVSDCLAVFFQYKMLGVGDMEFNCGTNDPLALDKLVEMDSYVNHHLVFGARVSF